jgi:hypothetical protein
MTSWRPSSPKASCAWSSPNNSRIDFPIPKNRIHRGETAARNGTPEFGGDRWSPQSGVTGVTSFSDLIIVQSGSDTVITAAADQVTLVNYDDTTHPLSASDFLFAKVDCSLDFYRRQTSQLAHRLRAAPGGFPKHVSDWACPQTAGSQADSGVRLIEIRVSRALSPPGGDSRHRKRDSIHEVAKVHGTPDFIEG